MISLSGLFENLLIAGPLLMLFLMPAGLLASCWVTNTVFDYFRKEVDESTSLDRFGALMLLVSIFGTYCYLLISIFQL